MISYKALTILTVLFNIIIYCNGTVEECKADTGFYNLNFILQFKDYEEFLQHVKTRIDIASYNEVILTEKYSYIGEFYTSIYNEKPQDLEDNVLKTPHSYCSEIIDDETVEVEGIDEMSDIEVEEFTINFIQKCTTSILEYRNEKGGKMFKYDENNKYKCLLTTYDMAVLHNPDQEKSTLFKKMLDKYKFEKPKGHVHKYYLYNIEIFDIMFDTFKSFTISKLCEQYFSKGNKEPSKQ